jgi:glycosyltransferase involved in cell wall biosynthesis
MRFTVFTPTFNRRHLLHRVTDSLEAQTHRDFEWILVDDGSTDDTRDWAEAYIRQAPFPARLIVNPVNSGKHVSWNRAVEMAQGEMFVVADSDDGFAPDALEQFESIWLGIAEPERARFSGVSVLCKDSETGRPIGDPFPASPLDTDELQLRYVLKSRGERWGCVRTALLRERPFPEAKGSHFAEDYIWMQLARHYKVRCVNVPLRIFFDERRDDRLTRERRVAIPAAKYEAGYLWNAFHLNHNADYLWREPRELMATAANLWRMGRILNRPFDETIGRVKHPLTKLLCLGLYPLGVALYERDRRRQRFQQL